MPLYDARVVADCKGKSFIEIALCGGSIKPKKFGTPNSAEAAGL
jgi:hypothetical protein